jgi:hypothetical protein
MTFALHFLAIESRCKPQAARECVLLGRLGARREEQFSRNPQGGATDNLAGNWGSLGLEPTASEEEQGDNREQVNRRKESQEVKEE